MLNIILNSLQNVHYFPFDSNQQNLLHNNKIISSLELSVSRNFGTQAEIFPKGVNGASGSCVTSHEDDSVTISRAPNQT